MTQDAYSQVFRVLQDKDKKNGTDATGGKRNVRGWLQRERTWADFGKKYASHGHNLLAIDAFTMASERSGLRRHRLRTARSGYRPSRTRHRARTPTQSRTPGASSTTAWRGRRPRASSRRKRSWAASKRRCAI